MKKDHILPVRRISSILSLLMLIFFSTTSAVAAGQASTPNLMRSVVLKHRIALVPVTSKKDQDKKLSVIVKSRNTNIIFPNGGIKARFVRAPALVELTKKELNDSELIRLVDLGLLEGVTTPGKDDFQSVASDTELALFASYCVDGEEKRVFFRLVDTETGQLLLISDCKGFSFEGAVQRAIDELESYLFTRAWRCSVVGVSDGTVIIDRGELDGLVEGIELVGYAMNAAPRNAGAEPIELRLMKYGSKRGLFYVAEVGEMYSKMKAAPGVNRLDIGDILELPAVKLRKNPKSRGSKIWDTIYDKK